MKDDLHITGGVEWRKWLRGIGRGITTGTKWTKPGKNGEPPRLTVCNIDGKNYLRAHVIDAFWARAEAGEFARKAKVPLKLKNAA